MTADGSFVARRPAWPRRRPRPSTRPGAPPGAARRSGPGRSRSTGGRRYSGPGVDPGLQLAGPRSNASGGSPRSSGASASNAAPTVTGRPVITRSSSATSPAAIRSLSSAREATLGTGTRWRRRNRPISPSTPPFSCAPSMPGAAEERVEPVVAAQRGEPFGLGPVPALEHPDDSGLEVVVADPAGHPTEVRRTPARVPRGTLLGPGWRTRRGTPCPSATGASRTSST